MVRADLENTIDFEASSSAKATFVEQGKAFWIICVILTQYLNRSDRERAFMNVNRLHCLPCKQSKSHRQDAKSKTSTQISKIWMSIFFIIWVLTHYFCQICLWTTQKLLSNERRRCHNRSCQKSWPICYVQGQIFGQTNLKRKV